MSGLLNSIKWDILLLNRNHIFLLSLIVSIIYTGIFFLLKPLGNLDTILIVLVFNDPVVTGFIFSGVILLLDKSQNTLQAIKVTPLPFHYYLISKTICLSLLSLFIAIIMTVAVKGFNFNPFHLTAGVLLITIFFIFSGFIFSAYSRTFNHFLLYAIGFLVISGLPFLSLFNIGSFLNYFLNPSFAGLLIIKAAFTTVNTANLIYSYLYLTFTTLLMYVLALKILKKIEQ